MRLESLQVHDFRSVRAATIGFGPGINVLHGPNELGKSTLVEAIHAALFVPTTSQSSQDYVTWGGSSPACVTLTFEHEGKLWRVSKRFGRRPEAKLESCEPGSARFREVVNGRGVEGKLRELLAWGIAPPGGRGAAPRAESFLLTALLGRQGEVQEIFNTSLDRDRDDTGKSLVTRALGALDNDPLVSRLLDGLRSRVAAVFNANGGLRTAADSPLVRLQQHLRTQREELERLQADEARGRSIQADVVRLQDEYQRLLGELETAEEGRVAAAEYDERARTRETLQAQIEEIRGRIAQADALAADLKTLDERLTTGKSNLEVLRRAEESAASDVAIARAQLQAAGEAVARATEAADQSQRVSDATVAQRQAELAMAKAAAETRLGDVAAAEQLVAQAESLEQQCREASMAHDSAVAAIAEAMRTLEHATARAALDDLLLHERTAANALEQLTGAQQREQAARERLDAAAAAIADAERRRDAGEWESRSDDINAADAEIRVLQAVESLLAIARRRAEVQALEEASQRARTLRTSAQANRSEASDIERRVATRLLPTSEQIASWRELEQALKTDSTQAPPKSSPLIPVILAAVAALAGVFVGIRLGMGLAVPVALLAGLLAAVVVGGLTWVSFRGRVRAQTAEQEQRERRRDRWAREVEPSLRAAGLETLAAYESAVADLERQKVEAQRLRNQADRDDLDAGNAERAAIPLDSFRDELDRLERERPSADPVAVTERAQALGNDRDRVRLRLGEVRAAREAARVRVQAEAHSAVTGAIEQHRERQAEYGAAARELAAAETTLRLAREPCNPEEATRLQARLADIGDAPRMSVSEASRALDAARIGQAQTSTVLETSKVQLEEARLRVAQMVAAFGGDLENARRQAQRDLDDVAGQLASLETSRAAHLESAATALEDAIRAHRDLELQLSSASASLESAAHLSSQEETALATLDTEAAALRGQLTAMNRPALEEREQQITSNPVFASSDGAPLDLAAAKAEVDRVQQQLDRCRNDLHHARGQLHLIAGHVGTERLAQQQEAVTLAHAEVLERERVERAALRLFREIESAEAERSTHLGRALAGPVTDAFRTLTCGRYGSIGLAPDLRTEHVEANGGSRPLAHLSVGTREQLATLLRLAIARHLQTAVILDDQLVHSDTGRLEWFKSCLRESASSHAHQVIVFTCRPGDYLSSDCAEDGVTAIDLTALVS